MVGPASSPAIRIRKGEFIIAIAWSNTATQILGQFRVVYDNGDEDDFRLSQTLLLNNRSAVLVGSQQIATDDGWIISGQMQQQPGVANQATQRGQCYVKACVVSGIDPGTTNSPTATIPQCKAMICCGYVYSGVEVSVGQLIEPGPAGGPGAIKRVNTAGSVGVGLVLGVVPTGAIWRWIAGHFQYTASATVGTRTWQTRFRDAAGNIFLRSIFSVPTANQTMQHAFARNYTTSGAVNLFSSSATTEDPTPNEPLPAGYDAFSVDTTAIDGLDVTSIEAQVEEWVVPN